MTRNGKIARLPRHIRHRLNSRLDDGEQAKDLVNWLNGLPQVRQMLSAHFGGREINEQNLSEWKQGGFRDWQRRQEKCDYVRSLVELSDDLDAAADERSINDRLACVLAAELAAEVQKLLEETIDPKERAKLLCDAIRQLNSLRQGDHAEARIQVERERWEVDYERFQREEKKAAMKEARQRITAPLWAMLRRPALIAAFGGGEVAKKIADFILQSEQEFWMPTSSWSVCGDPPGEPPFSDIESKPNQAESNQIKPDQS